MTDITYLQEGTLKTIFDAAAVIEIVRRLSTPFEKTEAFKAGLIDKDGNLKKPRNKMTQDERSKISLFDLLIFNIKKMMAKVTHSANLSPLIASILLLKESNLEDLKIPQLAESLITDFTARADYKTFLESEAPVNVSNAQVNPPASPTNIEAPDVLMGVGLKIRKYKKKNYDDTKKTLARRKPVAGLEETHRFKNLAIMNEDGEMYVYRQVM